MLLLLYKVPTQLHEQNRTVWAHICRLENDETWRQMHSFTVVGASVSLVISEWKLTNGIWESMSALSWFCFSPVNSWQGSDKTGVQLLCSLHTFHDYVDGILLDERTSFNNPDINSFFCIFFPKVSRIFCGVFCGVFCRVLFRVFCRVFCRIIY